MTEALDTAVNDYLTQFLLRYFRSATAVGVERPKVNRSQDLDLLRLHWAISEPIRELVGCLRENPQQLQAVLETRLREDDARIHGRFDARATAIRRLITGHPTINVSHEPRRTYESGPNPVLAWVLETAWRLVGRFRDIVPVGASYRDLIGACAPGLDAVRRFDALHQVAKNPTVGRRPSAQSVKEASRSRRPIYVLASLAYRRLLAIEAGEAPALRDLLNDSLLGPFHAWQRFELAVGLGIARGLSTVLGQGIDLGFFLGGGEPIARVGSYKIYWQARTNAYQAATREPSEVRTSALLKAYGLPEGTDRPDLVITVGDVAGEAIAVVEVKYYSSGENDAADSVRAAAAQLVRYVRGYRAMENIDTILDHSIIGLARMEGNLMPKKKPYGIPLLVDFDAIMNEALVKWARRLLIQREVAVAA